MQNKITKDQWVGLFKDTGLSEEMMHKWHTLFESKYPDAHQGFLEWLGISQSEIQQIRSNSK